MSITNCAAAGHDSQVTGPAGIVTRKDDTTGQQVAATVRPQGFADDAVQPAPEVQTAPQTLAALLLAQQEV